MHFFCHYECECGTKDLLAGAVEPGVPPCEARSWAAGKGEESAEKGEQTQIVLIQALTVPVQFVRRKRTTAERTPI